MRSTQLNTVPALTRKADWRTFMHEPGPGKDFLSWLAGIIPPCAEVIPIGAPAPPETKEWPIGDYRVFGPPVIAERATPALPRDRRQRRIELAQRMPTAVYRVPGTHKPRVGLPMWRMKAAFFHDYCGKSSLEIAQMTDLREVGRDLVEI